MPLFNAFLLLCALLVTVALTRRDRVHPFLAISIVALAFGVAADLSIGQITDAFGQGFGKTVVASGLVIVAACLIAVIADSTQATARITTATADWSDRTRGLIAVPLGLLAGMGAATPAAFAVLSPVRSALAGKWTDRQRQLAVPIGLALSAGHGMLWPSPVVIAAVAILRADIGLVLLYGVPTAGIAALAGALVSTLAANRGPDGLARDETPLPPMPVAAAPTPRTGGRMVFVLLLVTVMMIGQLIVQSIGTMPSEPLGGGLVRETLLGIGRPFSLLVVGVGLMWLAMRRSAATLSAPPSVWVDQGLGRAAPLILLVGAAGGLQALAQHTGMAELLTETVLDWHIGLALPFIVAAMMKMLQGSSLVAVITAAGMIEPLLGPLGLDTHKGYALAVVALGAGAVSGSHIIDPYFWLVSDAARLRPGRALLLLGGGTLFQGCVALGVLMGIAAAIG